MKKSILWLVLPVFLLVCHTAAQTPVEEGSVSGVWSKTGSPYMINGTVTIPSGSVLTIEPGVTVNFSGHYKFIVEGRLLAEALPGDSIIFTATDAETGWHGLRFLNTIAAGEDTSRIAYCRLEYGRVHGDCPDNRGGAVYAARSNVVISHCLIRWNKAISGAADWGGGAIYCETSNLIIEDNLITENYSGHDGGAVYCAFSRPVIRRNIITGNEAAMRGGGIASFTFSSPLICKNIIRNNTANDRGGGIYASGGSPVIQLNFIEENQAGLGGGIDCYLSEVQVVNNLIASNHAGAGGAVFIRGCSPVITCNTICDNEASLYGGGIVSTFEVVGLPVYSCPLLTANIVYGNKSEDGSQLWSASGCVPVLNCCDVQDMSGTGITGEINSIAGNIDLPPVFSDAGLSLYELSSLSPCIDAGPVNLSGTCCTACDMSGCVRVWDGNGDQTAVADMGAWEFGSQPLGTHEAQPDQPVVFSCNVFPNPSAGRVTFKIKASFPGTADIRLTNSEGRIIYRLHPSIVTDENVVYIDLSRLPAGVYIYEIDFMGHKKKGHIVHL
ncbi:MAG: T9SS type A sorting domain-containing protein [Lentimicrobium sp.]